MLDRDIDTAPALAHLTMHDNDPLNLSRRRFLQLVGLGVGAGLTGGSLLEAARRTRAHGRHRPSGRTRGSS